MRKEIMMSRFTVFSATALIVGTIAATGVALAQGRPDREPGPWGGPGRWGGPALDFTAIDSDGNGVLSREELTAFALVRISTVDTDGNGTLERAEIVAIFPDSGAGFFRPFAQPRGERFADRLLERMDAAEAGAVAVADLAERQVNAILARIDRDHDGSISQAEAENAPRHGARHARGGPDRPHQH